MRHQKQFQGSQMKDEPETEFSTAIQEEKIVGGEPTSEEVELVTWAEEMVRKSLVSIHEGLRQMITLATALLAGSTAVLGGLPIPTLFKAAGALALLLCLAFSLWGTYPREATVDIRCPEEIKEARENGLKVKAWCLWLASISLVVAFAALLLGLFLGGIFPSLLSR
jgi:hypothetical protein